MRDRLANRAGQRHLYIARLAVYGVRHLQLCRRKRRGTALMRDVRDGDWTRQRGRFLTAHVWVPYAEPFVAAGVERGQRVSFTAIATPYLRGQHGADQEPDYHLTDAQDVVILEGNGGHDGD